MTIPINALGPTATYFLFLQGYHFIAFISIHAKYMKLRQNR